MTEKKDPKKPAGIRLPLPEDLVMEINGFAEEAGVTREKLREIVGEAAFSLIRGNVRELYLSKLGVAPQMELPDPKDDVPQAPTPAAGKPMGV